MLAPPVASSAGGLVRPLFQPFPRLWWSRWLRPAATALHCRTAPSLRTAYRCSRPVGFALRVSPDRIRDLSGTVRAGLWMGPAHPRTHPHCCGASPVRLSGGGILPDSNDPPRGLGSSSLSLIKYAPWAPERKSLSSACPANLEGPGASGPSGQERAFGFVLGSVLDVSSSRLRLPSQRGAGARFAVVAFGHPESFS